MKDGKHPTPNTIHPIAGYDKEIYVKPTITNPEYYCRGLYFILPIRILKVMFHTYTSGMMTNSSSESSVKSPPELSL
ncbi:MAG: hypothetical protein ACLRIP_03355 [Blautia massiliensis (ex Durand et al. 2017)]